MASKNNRKLSGVVLTGALVAPAVMSAAQQNVASADFLSSLKSWGSWAGNVAMKGINAALSTTYGKIGLCTLAAVALCGIAYLVDKLIDKLIPDDEGEFFDYGEIRFDDKETMNFNGLAKDFKDSCGKEYLSTSLINLLAYLKNTENIKDGSINLLIKNEGGKLQIVTVSKSACVRALKKTLDVLVRAANESPEVLKNLFDEKLFGEAFAGYLSEERVEVNGVVAGFQIPTSSANATERKGEDSNNMQIINSIDSKDFDQNKTNETHYFDESYKNLGIEADGNKIEIK